MASASEAIEKMIKLALRRHKDGIPNHLICFDENGAEVPWGDVVAASPKQKIGEMEHVAPTPGVGYFCHVSLRGTNYTPSGESHTFEFAAPDWKHTATLDQPHSAPATISSQLSVLDEKIKSVLEKIAGTI